MSEEMESQKQAIRFLQETVYLHQEANELLKGIAKDALKAARKKQEDLDELADRNFVLADKVEFLRGHVKALLEDNERLRKGDTTAASK